MNTFLVHELSSNYKRLEAKQVLRLPNKINCIIHLKSTGVKNNGKRHAC